MTIERLEATPRYSKIVVHDSTIYLAGLIANDWERDITQQALEVFGQIDELLVQAGSDRSKILSMTCWIKDFADYAAFNETYDSWVDSDHLPARATVRADMLDDKILIEVMCIAAR